MGKIIKMTESELRSLVASIINNTIKRGVILHEGVDYDSINDIFSFNFKEDNDTNIIKLAKVGYNVKAFGHCLYYAYEFADNADSDKRSAFIHSIKFPDGRISEEDKNEFIINAVDSLDKEICLPLFDLLVYPESLSELNRQMLGYLNRIAQPNVISMELVKTLPSKIEFDYERFKLEVLDARLPNGRNRYTDKQKEIVLGNIRSIMDAIHKLDYFSIARDVKKTKYRPYIKNYYKFKSENDRKLYESMMNGNILVIDDIATSGTTISHILSSLRCVNNSNKIVIFSLIGKNILKRR